MTNKDIEVIAQGNYIDDTMKGKEYEVRTYTLRVLNPELNNELLFNPYLPDPYTVWLYREQGEPFGYTREEWEAKVKKQKAKAQAILGEIKDFLHIDRKSGFCLTQSLSEVYTVVETAEISS